MSLKGIFPIDLWDFNSHGILTELPAADYNTLMAHSREEKVNKGEIIFREDAKPTGIFYIRKGKIKKYKTDNTGKEHIFYVANTGELIGYHAVLSAENYPDSAATLEDSIITFIPVQDFTAVLNRSPELSGRLLKILSHEFSVLINSITVFAQRPVRERMAIALILLREKFKQETMPGKQIIISISRDDIANMAGTSRENATRFITEFKNEKLVETIGRKIVITDVIGLVAIANQA
jgi:CRP-like cAMP-binding protein